MNEKLEAKCDLIGKNYKVCAKSAKLDFAQAASLGALLLTSKDILGDEQKIRACRKLLKSKVGPLNNMRGYTNLALLTKMSCMDNKEEYLDSVIKVYNMLKGKIVRSSYHPLAAQTIVENANPKDYEKISQNTLELVKDMRKKHPLITSYADSPLASLLVMSEIDTDELFDNAEQCYEYLKGEGFKLNKGTLQTISLILALCKDPIEKKCERFKAIRQALKDAKHPIKHAELAVIAALVDTNIPVETIAEEIAQADDKLKKTRGFGWFAAGKQLRRLYACALVLQVHEKEIASSQSSNMSHIIVQHIIQTIVDVIIIAAVTSAAAASAAASGN